MSEEKTSKQLAFDLQDIEHLPLWQQRWLKSLEDKAANDNPPAIKPDDDAK